MDAVFAIFLWFCIFVLLMLAQRSDESSLQISNLYGKKRRQNAKANLYAQQIK
ncbi:MAG TPA: hypothetical protein VIM43_03530 [Rugosibacter sp.]